jgi:hypothetical protein
MKQLRAFAAYLEHASALDVVFAIVRWSLVLGVMVVGVRLVASLVFYPVFRVTLDPVIELAVLGAFGVAGALFSLLVVGILGLAKRHVPTPGEADLPTGPAEPPKNPALLFGPGPNVPR